MTDYEEMNGAGATEPKRRRGRRAAAAESTEPQGEPAEEAASGQGQDFAPPSTAEEAYDAWGAGDAVPDQSAEPAPVEPEEPLRLLGASSGRSLLSRAAEMERQFEKLTVAEAKAAVSAAERVALRYNEKRNALIAADPDAYRVMTQASAPEPTP